MYTQTHALTLKRLQWSSSAHSLSCSSMRLLSEFFRGLRKAQMNNSSEKECPQLPDASCRNPFSSVQRSIIRIKPCRGRIDQTAQTIRNSHTYRFFYVSHTRTHAHTHLSPTESSPTGSLRFFLVSVTLKPSGNHSWPCSRFRLRDSTTPTAARTNTARTRRARNMGYISPRPGASFSPSKEIERERERPV